MATPVTDGMNAGVVAAIINAQGTQIDNVEQALPDKADLQGGVLPVAQLPEIPEEKLPDTYYNGVQFERVLVDGVPTIQLKQSFIDSISGGGTPVDPDVAAPVGSLTGRNYKFVQATWPNDLELRTNGGIPVAYVSGTNIAVGDGAVAANYYEARVKAVSGIHKASAWVGNPSIAAAGGGDSSLITGFSRMDLVLPQRLSAGGDPTVSGNKYTANNGEYNTVSPYKLENGARSGIVITAGTNALVRVHNGYSLFGSGSYNFQYSGGVLSGSVSITTQPQVGDKVLFLRSSGGGNGSLSIVKTSDNGATYQTISAASMDLFAADQWMGFDIQPDGEISVPQISSVVLDPVS